MPKDRLVKKSVSLILITLFLKLIGFIKQSVIAWKFGTTADLDVYYAADGYISTFSLIILATVPAAIVTLILKIKEKEKKEYFINSVLTALLIIGVLLTIANIVTSSTLTKLLGISFDPGQQVKLQKYLMFLSPMIVFSCLTSVSAGLLQSKQKFIQQKLFGLCLAMGIIIFSIMLGDKMGTDALLLGFMFGFTIFVIIMAKSLITSTRLRLVNPLKNEQLKKFFKTVLPLIVGVGLVDLSHLIDKIIASSLGDGSVSSLYYSQVICSDLVNGVIISSIGIVLLPKLVKDIQSKTPAELSKNISRVLNVSLPIIMLITALYAIVGQHLVTIAFERGEFTQDSTAIVVSCVMGYAIGLIFILIKEILCRYFYAIEDTKTPMVSNIIGIAANIALSIVLSHSIGVQGIAYATSISILITDIVLFIIIRKKHTRIRIVNLRFMFNLCKMLAAISISAFIGKIINDSLLSNDLIELIIVSASMLAVFCLLLILLKTSCYDELKKLLHGRNNRTNCRKSNP